MIVEEEEAAMIDAEKISRVACMLPHRYFEYSCCCLRGGSVESSPTFSGFDFLLFITFQTLLMKRVTGVSSC